MPSRYLIGIDLGTTNSVVAYIDTHPVTGTDSDIRILPVPQLVAHGEVRTLPALPSFVYFPTEEELSAGVVSATWDEEPPMVTGVLARDQGALVPSRQVSSAKSWLSYAGVDRRAKILPWQAEPPEPMISPVEASARYVMHLRDAWNKALGGADDVRFERQDIVLTVPASFDQEARELTVEAASRAGLKSVTLLEEPLAAFYAWIAATCPAGDLARDLQAEANGSAIRDGELILICDIGGGTSDFTLVRARSVGGELDFERTAIGEHLLLGGDNLDLALARVVEEKLKDVRLTFRQRYALRLACCSAKERLLSNVSLDRVPVTILGSGQAVVGRAISVDLTREEVLRTLTDGFLPITAPDEMPVHGRTTGLRELGLPYAADAAITRHLAAFLIQGAAAMNGSSPNLRLARPDAVLFNGGFCAPAVTRKRITEAISAWLGEGRRPKILDNAAVESAVARGAAYYGRVRRGAGLRIRAGSARTYYIGVRSADGLQGICVLPAGVDEGATLPLLNREFSVLANRPVSFTLYSSRLRYDAHGAIVVLDEASVHRHAPLVTVLRYGRKVRDTHLTVRLRASFTEVGTLELWCESRDTPHRWRLQFELRGGEQEQLEGTQPATIVSPPAATATSNASIESAAQLIRWVFGDHADGNTFSPDHVVIQMESALGARRDSWPIVAIRRFADVLIEVAAGRGRSPHHEVRWLNLAGFCLRPGFGAPDDDVRVSHLQRIASAPVFEDDLPCQVETLVLMRRIAGGLNASQQQALYRNHAPLLGRGTRGSTKKRVRVNRQLEFDTWRLIASLEHLPGHTRASLGSELLVKIRGEPEDAIRLWSLGRLGARIPIYGPLHSVVAAETASQWVLALLRLSPFSSATASAIVMVARHTGNATRDIENAVREQAISRMMAAGIAEDTIQLVSTYIPPDRADAVRNFGESLPPGLELVSSSNCLLSLPALQSCTPHSSTPE